MRNIKNLRISKKLLALLVAGTFALTGCGYELAPQEDYDVVVHGNGDLSAGLRQVLEVPGEGFKLVTEYSCDDESKREWRITSDKFLYFNVHTEGLPEGYQVYIDNIHIDTSIKSCYAAMDGIQQDTMDDRVHSSQLTGFPISDTTMYYGVNAIEGCNETFIRGTCHGINGYHSGSVSEKRYTEKDYLEYGVYANKFLFVYDLLVKGPNDPDFYNVSVKTDFIVEVTSSLDEIEYGTKENQKVK